MNGLQFLGLVCAVLSLGVLCLIVHIVCDKRNQEKGDVRYRDWLERKW